MATKKKDTENNITSTFKLDQLVMKKDFEWRIRMVIQKTLLKMFYQYHVELTFDEEPYLRNIEKLRERLEMVKSDNQLFEKGHKKAIKDAEAEIAEAESEMDMLREQCVDIEFDGTIEEIKHKDSETQLTLAISPSVIALLNDQRLSLRYYKVELSQK